MIGVAMKKLLLIGALLVLSSQAYAYEVKKVCGSYQSGFQWTRSQAMTIQIYSGMELSRGAYNPNIKSYVNYAFINWSNAPITVVEITSPYVLGGMMFQTEGNDQNGRKWRFSDNTTNYCI